MITMPEWVNTTLENLQAGDVSTGIAVLVALVAIFFLAKILLNSMKAILIVLAVIVAIAILLPEANIIDKAKDATQSATDYVKDSITPENIEALKEKAAELAK